MAILEVKNLTFKYPHRVSPAVNNVSLSIAEGDFTVICGRSGCGKTTLLRHFKSVITPYGETEGEVLYFGKPLKEMTQRKQTAEIGYVLQSPENQIVTDKVWHELAFGLESLGFESRLIKLRVAEMASFFGIESWLENNVAELSGGQKQLLNLASIMAMHPRLLVLDEPTSQLDPIAAGDFLATVKKINRELGITVVMTEQRLEEVLPLADNAIMMADGEIIAQGPPAAMAKELFEGKNDLFRAMPAAMRIYAALDNSGDYPLTVKEGRKWLNQKENCLDIKELDLPKEDKYTEAIIRLEDIWFRYDKHLPDIVNGLSLEIPKGKLSCIVGGNGSGKTTTLSLLCGLNRPYRGKVLLEGKSLKKYPNKELYGSYFGLLPQNPQPLFVKKTVGMDLAEMLDDEHINEKEKGHKIAEVADLMEIGHLLYVHPYDLSGGEQQRAAFAKLLLMNPKIILLDEPTKGLDAHFKYKLAGILHQLAGKGVTIIMVSHDIEFCAQYGDVCSLFFGGNIVSSGEPHRFFAGNSFYTTSANRICRHILPYAITVEEVIKGCHALNS